MEENAPGGRVLLMDLTKAVGLGFYDEKETCGSISEEASFSSR